MTEKLRSSLAFLVLLLPFQLCAKATAVTIDELAGICEKMESAITDISFQFEWYVMPAPTIEQLAQEVNMPPRYVRVAKDGTYNFKVAAKVSGAGLHDPNIPLFEYLYVEDTSLSLNYLGVVHEGVLKQSYDGNALQFLTIAKKPKASSSASIYKDRGTFNIGPSPLDYMLLSFRQKGYHTLLSTFLREHKSHIRLDDTVEQINGFNAIRLDFLIEDTDQPYMQVYLSPDYGYAPVRYKHTININKGNFLTFDVHSLQKVAEGLWFPTSGMNHSTDEDEVQAFQVIGDVVINQGLTAGDFDIEFPVGTRVHDEIQGRTYIVEAPQQ